MTEEEFRKEIEKHDWHYAMSDDGKVYARGQQAHTRLLRIATDGPTAFRRIWNEIEAKQYPKDQFSTYKPTFEFAEGV